MVQMDFVPSLPAAKDAQISLTSYSDFIPQDFIQTLVLPELFANSDAFALPELFANSDAPCYDELNMWKVPTLRVECDHVGADSTAALDSDRMAAAFSMPMHPVASETSIPMQPWSSMNSMSARISMMGHEKSEYDVSPKAEVIAARALHNRETLYLIRLREDWDCLHSYHIKTLTEFWELDARLRETFELIPPEDRVLQRIPRMPEKSRFGLRGQLSKLGFGHFLDRQHEGIQNYISVLLKQVPNTAADFNLQNFFSTERTAEDKAMIRMMVMECRQGICLKLLKGRWTQGHHVWTIDETGRALLDGKYQGTGFDLVEQGEGLQMTIRRADGWRVDIEKSTTQALFWVKPGYADLEWTRVVHK